MYVYKYIYIYIYLYTYIYLATKGFTFRSSVTVILFSTGDCHTDYMALLRSPLHTCHDVMCFVYSSNRTCFEIIAHHHETHESVERNTDGCEGLSCPEPSQSSSAGSADSSEVAHVGAFADTLWENITCLFAVKTKLASFKYSQPTGRLWS